MARRRGREGSWLATDDTTGFTRYGSELKLDFWGNRTAIPLKRNLQEIAIPLDDFGPVPFYRGPSYETYTPPIGYLMPTFVGLTTVPTNPNNMAVQVLDLDPAIPDMEIGTNFIVR